MKLFVLLTCALIPFRQEGEARKVAGLLNSDDVEEREAASEKLLEMGESARGILEETVRGTQIEASKRAQEILVLLDMRRRLGPRLLKAMPGLDHKLVHAEDGAWTEALLEATEQIHVWRRHPELGREDIDPLARAAVRGATPANWGQVCNRVAAWNLRSAIPELIKRMLEIDEQGLFPLRDALRELDVPEAAPTAAEMLGQERNEQKRLNYLFILMMGDGSEVLTTLIRLLRQDRRRIFEIHPFLVSVPSVKSIQDVIALFDSEESFSRDDLGGLLGRSDARRAILALKDRMARGTDYSRRVAAGTLCRIRHRAAVPEILALLKGGDRLIQMEAITALGSMEECAAGVHIRPFLSDEDRWMRLKAAKVLAVWGDPAALPIIREFVRDPQMADAVVGYLGFLPRDEVVGDFLSIVRTGGPGLGSAAAWLGRLNHHDCVKELTPLLKHGKDGVRIAAATGLASSGRREAISLLIPLFNDSSDRVPYSIAESLGKTGAPEAVEALIKEAENPKSRARDGAIRALGRLGFPEASPCLWKLVDGKDVVLRKEAFSALAKIDPPDIHRHLKMLLTDTDPIIRFESAQWLTRLGEREGVDLLLRRRSNLFLLNAIRSPVLWKKLALIRCEIPLGHSCRRGLDDLAARAGMKLDIDEDYAEEFRRVATDARDMIGGLSKTDFILEEDRIRVLPSTQACAFWRQWWARESGR